MQFHKVYWLMAVIVLRLIPVHAEDAPFTLEQVADGFAFPTAIVQAPGDSQRLYIADLHGKVSIVEDGVLLDEPFIDLSAEISTLSYGQGLHNIVFHPDYAENGYFFAAYSQTDGNATLVRYQASPDSRHADPDSGMIIMVLAHPTDLHYGGQLAFGPDGYLYWSMGDGGYKKSPAQRLDTYLGVIMRLDVDGDPYRVPENNPFVGKESAFPELWANGLRNPWRFSFDRHTGDLYIADVGESAYEEINFQPAGSPGGQNYGWNRYEGHTEFMGGDQDGLTFPVVEYPHDNGNCSITGGYVYRGAALPDLVGKYVFADYCSGWIWTTYRQQNGIWYTAQLMKTNLHITTFGEDNEGELYVGEARGGVYKLVPAESK